MKTPYGTEWVLTSSAREQERGFKDYQTQIKFTKELSAFDLDSVLVILQTTNCPGWTKIISRHEGSGLYTFFTTMDSSD